MLGAAICGQAAIKQYPGLDEVIYPHETVSSQYYRPWLQGLYLRFGEELTVISQEDLVLSEDERRKVEEAHRALLERDAH